MADPALKLPMTYAEYLAFERASPTKHEFVDGEVWAMAGGTPEHGRLAAAVIGILYAMLHGRPCRPYSSDVRVYIEQLNEALYPDVSVVCGRLQLSEADPDAMTNPTLLVEVLSPSSEAYDRGKKFEKYRRLASLRHYLLVAQETPRIEHFRRNDDGTWRYSSHGPGDTVYLDSLDGTLAVDEVFAR